MPEVVPISPQDCCSPFSLCVFIDFLSPISVFAIAHSSVVGWKVQSSSEIYPKALIPFSSDFKIEFSVKSEIILSFASHLFFSVWTLFTKFIFNIWFSAWVEPFFKVLIFWLTYSLHLTSHSPSVPNPSS